jgi:glycine cleavage system transcriptional repressor
LIINAVGSDRLGIVSDMTKYVTDAGGNVGESQAAKLGGHFSLMMLVSVPEASLGDFHAKLKNMKDMTASVYMVDADAKAVPMVPKIAYSGRFTLEGADNPGIVHKVTTILSHNGLNIDKMETSDEIAPHGGTTLFKMRGTAHAYDPLAAGFDPSKIRSELSALGNELNCDIDMEDCAEDEYQGSFSA